MMSKPVVSFLSSGRGMLFSSVARSILTGRIRARLGILISDSRDAGALLVARDLGMESFFIYPGDFENKQDYERRFYKLLKKVNTDLVVCAGYLRILSPFFVKRFRNRIINIHPSLLPSFPGTQSQRRAIEYGVKITGCTSHFIDEGIDTGPIILQSPVPIFDTDSIETLSRRVLKEEYKVLTESVRLFCDRRLRIAGRKVIVR